jgi:hypothetical protein
MTRSPVAVLAGALLSLAGAAHAEQAANTSTSSAPTSDTPMPAAPKAATLAPAAVKTATAAAKTEQPSPDVVKRAMDAGLKPMVTRGGTLFCRTDITLGTRLPSRKCFNETQLQVLLDRRQTEQDQFMRMQAPGLRDRGKTID